MSNSKPKDDTPSQELIEQFTTMLKKHDWHYEQSDSHATFNRGAASIKAIRLFMANHDHEVFYELYKTHSK